MPSVTGYVAAAEWLAEAKRDIRNAIECLGQIRSIIDDVKTEMATAPVPRGATNREDFNHLENAEDEIIRIVAALRIDWTHLESCHIKDFESWRNAAVEAYDRKHGL